MRPSHLDWPSLLQSDPTPNVSLFACVTYVVGQICLWETASVSRSARLLDLIQVLRPHRRSVAAARPADELGVSLRTIYRDIETLAAQGAPVEGEAGLGYILRRGFVLPPLMFGEDEVDTLILGLRLVAERGDPDLECSATARMAGRVASPKNAPETPGVVAAKCTLVS